MSQKLLALDQLTQERKTLNGIEQAIKLLINNNLSFRPETTLALRSVQMATMWLGKCKQVLNPNGDPYPNSRTPGNPVIEQRADVADGPSVGYGANEVACIKELRAQLRTMERAIENDQLILTDNRKYQAAIVTAWTHCCNASMWLGMVLNAIKTEGSLDEIRNKAKESLAALRENGVIFPEFPPKPEASIQKEVNEPSTTNTPEPIVNNSPDIGGDVPMTINATDEITDVEAALPTASDPDVVTTGSAPVEAVTEPTGSTYGRGENLTTPAGTKPKSNKPAKKQGNKKEAKDVSGKKAS